MPKKQSTTWLEFIESSTLSDKGISNAEVDSIKNILAVDKYFNSFFHYNVPAFYLLDYTTGKYITVSKSSEINIGHSYKRFMDGGLSFIIDNYHKDDLKLYNEKIFPDRLQAMKHFNVEDFNKYVFSYTFRLKNADGTFCNILQRNCFINSDDSKTPVASFGIAFNIGHFRTENPIVQTIEKLNPDNALIPVETISKKTYFLNEEDMLFSKREKEILYWTADGLTSKEIAEKLIISESTVINHRKSMLLKSNTKNVAELVAFSIRNHII